jgi:hypothetical protein
VSLLVEEVSVEEVSLSVVPQAAKQVAVISTAATKAKAFSFIVLTLSFNSLCVLQIASKNVQLPINKMHHFQKYGKPNLYATFCFCYYYNGYA